jgi:hypothetical protein
MTFWYIWAFFAVRTPLSQHTMPDLHSEPRKTIQDQDVLVLLRAAPFRMRTSVLVLCEWLPL